MIEFYDMDIKEMNTLEIGDIENIFSNGDNLLIENIDGLFFTTDKIHFI